MTAPVLGLDGVSQSEVSRICAELDPLVEAFRTRALTTEYPYIWVDATYQKVRVNGRVVDPNSKLDAKRSNVSFT